MKKVIVAILAMTVLISCIIPCADINICFHGSSNTEATVSKPVAKENNHSDTCSPFCICSCCGCPSTKAQIADISFKVEIQEITFSTFVLKKPSTISLPVWEPPKIG